ncbi:Cyanovirin-N [Rhizoctonia solani]|nr:Cyanovirin-N [Rhizoctonia solani]
MAFAASATLDSIQLGDSHILSAMLLRINGEWKPATFDLNDCIGNINGTFAWGGKGFSHTASNVVIDMSHAPTLVRLVAALKRFDGSYAASDIHLNECIANMDGEFKHILPTQV